MSDERTAAADARARLGDTFLAADRPVADREPLSAAIAYALARASLPTEAETSGDYADRLAPLVIESGYLDAARSTAPATGPGLDEPTLTRILGEIAPVVGGDLLTGGVRHWVGLSSAIIERLRAATEARSGVDDVGEGLDVRRVKQAVVNVAARHGIEADPPRTVEQMAVARIFGYSAAPVTMDAEIAREYAALATTQPERREP